ncbi:MAG: polysaccharide deacetylase family protein [Oscillospiraceae bacterium]|jgi:peptidoglycan-N-acetylmuramic acid deacetylase|nr:polysaccharide deacetylase family protein [Oscillospiraceae bacterium]
MKKTITLSVIIAVVGCVLLFTGCEPNVNNDGIGENINPIETTPRTTTTPPPITREPEHDRDNENEIVDEEEAVGNNPTAFSFTIRELDAGEIAAVPAVSDTAVGWGLGRETDDRNRPLDALAAQSKYGHLGAVFIDDKTDSKIYLTFDEGYENGFSCRILDVLREKNAAAVFFITYDYAKNEPELVRRMIDEGHALGNHSWSHPSFPNLNDEQIREEIMKLHDYIKENFNYEMRLIRFPMGEFSERVLTVTRSLGYQSVFWSFAYVDWNVSSQPNPVEALEKITKAAHPGAVILLHAVSSTNAEILGDVIDCLRGQGLKPGLLG